MDGWKEIWKRVLKRWKEIISLSRTGEMERETEREGKRLEREV